MTAIRPAKPGHPTGHTLRDEYDVERYLRNSHGASFMKAPVRSTS